MNTLSVHDPKFSQYQQLVERLKLLVSGGRKLTDNEIEALAFFSTIEELDPCIGEAYLLKNDRTGEILGPVIGYKGLLRKCQEQMPEGENFFLSPRIVNPPTDDILYAVEAELRDTVSLKNYLNLRKEFEALFRSSGEADPAGKAIEVVGPPPVIRAHGYFYKSEANDFKDKKYHPKEKAEKRACMAALRKRFSIKTPVVEEGNGSPIISTETNNIKPSDFIEAEFNETSAETTTDKEPVKEPVTQTEPPKKGNGKPPAPAANPVAAIIDAGLAENPYEASHIVNFSPYPKGGMSIDDLVAWAKIYRAWRDAGAEKDAAITNANEGINVPE